MKQSKIVERDIDMLRNQFHNGRFSAEKKLRNITRTSRHLVFLINQ
jgi:hypothetical protein